MRRIESDSAFSGNYVCECPDDLTYALGFNYKIDDSIENANALTLYAIDLHEILEQAIQDYADDNDFEDYDPSY